MLVAVSFDLFGSFLAADQPAHPWAAVAEEDTARDVAVPAELGVAYRRSHRGYERGGARSLDDHWTPTDENQQLLGVLATDV